MIEEYKKAQEELNEDQAFLLSKLNTPLSKLAKSKLKEIGFAYDAKNSDRPSHGWPEE